MSTAKLTGLATELISMAKVDQAMRHRGAKTGEYEESVDTQNTARLKQIIAEFGWPTISLVGTKAATAAWLLAQHADLEPDFQTHCLELITKLDSGEIDASNRAFFEDRVRINTGRPQLYGSQFHKRDGVVEPLEIEDPEHVDKRRASVGLSTLAEYHAQMAKIFDEHEHNSAS